MDDFDALRMIPFAAVAIHLLCWAITEIVSERGWDVFRLTIIVTGFSTAWYVASLALNYSWMHVSFPPGYYDLVRFVMGITIIGLPWSVVNTWRAIRAWRCRRKARRKEPGVWV